MSDLPDQLDAIQERSNDPFSAAASDIAQMDADRDYLLDLARKQQAALEAVCHELSNAEAFGRPVSASHVLAAVRSANDPAAPEQELADDYERNDHH